LQEVAAGGFEFIHKPVDADELRRRLASLVKRHRP
jgi:hypothetical protein